MQVFDKQFESFITAQEINFEVNALAQQISKDYDGKELVFIALLNGAFMFASDLMKAMQIPVAISFAKVSSYAGATVTSGHVKELIGIEDDLSGKHVVIIEDIVDTGKTIDAILPSLVKKNPASIKICTLLFKPEAFEGNTKPDYIGFSIPNNFVVGYGLDYNELGRNLNAIYQLKTTPHSMLNIVLFGPPGAGKGTQSERLIDKYGLFHLSTGDIFRANIKGNTELGILAKSYMDQGQLVPDQVTINMIKSELELHPNVKGIIFDGFPRTNAQASALDELLSEMGTEISLMLALEVEEEELKIRLKKRAESSGRIDDANPEVIENRIRVYNNETAPVKEFYQQKGKFVGVNGIGSIDEITDRLFTQIDLFKS